jgi:nucleoside-diphosphate-sugar epimerase
LLPAIPRPDRTVLTGASGFVGSALARALGTFERLSLGRAHWREALGRTDFRGATVIHLAARVHDPNAPEAAYDVDNVEKTRALAESAIAGGAVRVVLASTVKVFGEESGDRPLREDDPPRPEDAYARSKWRAEECLREMSGRSGLPVVVVRIPLAYGPGAVGNFRALLGLADSGLWLPLSGIRNRRSLVHVDDLASALVLAATHPAAPGRTLLAAHPAPVSTPELVERMRCALGRPRRLFSVTPGLLEAMAALAGQGSRIRRLTRSLEVDPTPLVKELGWVPRMTLEKGLATCLPARGFA